MIQVSNRNGSDWLSIEGKLEKSQRFVFGPHTKPKGFTLQNERGVRGAAELLKFLCGPVLQWVVELRRSFE